jgi:pimeloyl-ACP methyl ester carboxylesterase
MEPRILQYDISGAGEPLVLVPGGLTGWLSWLPHQERLAATHRVIRVQPIHNELGSAGQPGDPTYTAGAEREALRLTLDAIGIDAADFAGWSGGGRALIEFALAYPKRVRTLTLVEPAAAWILDGLGERHAEVEEMQSLLHGLAGRAVTEEDLARFLRVAGFVGDGEDARQLPAWPRWLPHRMALSWQSARLDHPGRAVAELRRITQPVLLVKGTATADWLKRVVDALSEQLPLATVLELEGNHACHIQSIDGFLAAMRQHLTSADRVPIGLASAAQGGH